MYVYALALMNAARKLAEEPDNSRAYEICRREAVFLDYMTQDELREFFSMVEDLRQR